MKAKEKKPKKITVNLALQGGGAQGAFTWGVLDRLLEEKTIHIEGISGTSAGAMNAAALACGFIKGGHEGGRKNLYQFWRAISACTGALNPAQMWSAPFKNDFLGWSPSKLWMDSLSQILSPYQINPFNYSPLQEVLRKNIDFAALNNTKKIKLFVGATNVETNMLKVFHNDELCEEALLASACLPTISQAVKWKGRYYWDGGYIGNPVLEPLIYHCDSKDIIIVPINAICHKGVPKTPKEILNRLNEVTFNASLMREIRVLLHIQALSKHLSPENPYAEVRLHSIQNEEFMKSLGADSKFNTDWSFLSEVKSMGREAADKWIKKSYHIVGKETTMDLGLWRMDEV
ncbi:MAG TPA: patatin-like phospholipase family protein [Alphaproteobacteria bacterium]|nr:patatin-like phospholipase family protein [Alphaproteobacteria bacterium]